MSIASSDTSQYREYLDPKALATVEDLELLARWMVEGFKQGLHRSPFVGFSVEFSSHREYLPGDDLRHINWKAYGRQDRLYIKEFDAETNLGLQLVVDVSASMKMESAGVSKLRYAVMLAAGLAHLALSQSDAVGITLFADKVVDHVKPKANSDQLFEILHPLTRIANHPSNESPEVLHEVATLIPRRSLIVLLGDFFFESDELAGCLQHLRQNGSDVLFMHVLDPIEQQLSVDGPVKFHDLETGREIIAQAQDLRGKYQEAIAQWQSNLTSTCQRHGVDYFPVTTDEYLDKALGKYLANRSEMF